MRTKLKGPVHSGGRKVRRGEMQTEAASGRDGNRQHKQNFKQGAFAMNDLNAGRPNGPLLTPRQNATPSSQEEKS